MANSWEEVMTGVLGATQTPNFTWEQVQQAKAAAQAGGRVGGVSTNPDREVTRIELPGAAPGSMDIWEVNPDGSIVRANRETNMMEGFAGPGEGGSMTPISYKIDESIPWAALAMMLPAFGAAMAGAGGAAGLGGAGTGLGGGAGWVSGADLALGSVGLGEGAGALAASAPGWVSGSELALGNAGLGNIALPAGGMSATGTLGALGAATPEAALAAQIQAAGLAGTELGMTGTGLGGLAGLTGAPTALGAGALAAAGGATAGAGGLSSLLASLGGTGGAGSLLGSLGGLAGNLYGLSKAGDVAEASDPWGTSGNRALSGEMLMALLNDPSKVSATPGYGATMAASEQALTRNLASQGFTGSGLSAQALATFGGQFQNQAYKEQVQTLAGLAGAGGVSSPGAGQQSAYNNLGTNLAGLGSSLGQFVQSPAWSSGLASLSSLWG